MDVQSHKLLSYIQSGFQMLLLVVDKHFGMLLGFVILFI